MDRISLDNGGWFDRSQAKCYEEDLLWDGKNYISCATRSQWEHQYLYHTTGGSWVLYKWSQFQGSLPSYTQITAHEAVRWLIMNGHDIPDNLKALATEQEL